MAKRKVTSRKAAKSELLSRKRWQLQAAKAQFSEVFRRVRSEGPQWVTKQGREAVVIVRAEEFERLSRGRQPESLVEFFAKSPLAKVDLRFDRRSDYGGILNCERISARHQRNIRTRAQETRAEGGAVDPRH